MKNRLIEAEYDEEEDDEEELVGLNAREWPDVWLVKNKHYRDQ